MSYSGIANQSINYGAAGATVSGTLAVFDDGSQFPQGEAVWVTLGDDTQEALIGAGGAFSTTLTNTVKSP